jgi:RND family efflux transporter MFP subunit
LIAESKVDLEASEKQLEILKKDFESTKTLFDETKSISEQEVFRKELEFMVAQAEYDRLILAEQLEEFEYKIAKAQLEKRLIIAPFDGVIVEVIAEVGENCSPQQPLIRIADTRQVRLVVYVEPNISRKLRPSMIVTINIEGNDSTLVRRGEVEFISPVVDPSSGLREVKVLFNNANGSVPPGATGSLMLE